MESNHRDDPMVHKNQTKECSFQHYYSVTLEYTLERSFSYLKFNLTSVYIEKKTSL